MIHLKAVYKKERGRTDTFPFNVPAIQALEQVEFRQPVTFLVGENGSGKSTFLEALAAGIGAITVGGEDIKSDETLPHARKLATGLRLVWHMKTKHGFFMRAEDFFNFAKRINQTCDELTALAIRYENELQEKPDDFGVRLALDMALGQKSALTYLW